MALFDNFGANLFPSIQRNSDALLQSGLGLLAGKTGNEQAALGLKGFSDARKLNKTVEFLKNANPELAQAVEAGSLGAGDAYKLYYQQKLEAQKPRNNFMAVGKNLYDTTNGQWVSPPAGVGGADDSEYGLAPVYGTDAQGRTVLGQLSKNGTFQQTKLPDGFTPTPGTSTSDLGTTVVTRNSRTGRIIDTQEKDLAGAERDKAVGKSQGDAAATYKSMVSKMPGLEGVIGRLEGLADEATYTLAGRGLDWGRSQIGMEPRDAAVARAQYNAMVDNQILPLLKDTFGAQFTQKEGETLRATLGDDGKSPAEKKAVLRAFIEQKRRDVEALALQGLDNSPAPAAPSGNRTAGGLNWSVEP
ncbi:hypothetical protein [Agrobacterium radiobacter]|uniref:hypothetical protein n=1 Tax=Agrobacterium radiobacter TaxID=362 RepID=UPI001606A975|nr:hypothetical protein [Agrobacterium radiobacter]MBB4407099.1 hypothetical protein [Agrobacterium radiobacter]MBB4452697.1 hypothetical protein [Agrobacterium radiobacter]